MKKIIAGDRVKVIAGSSKGKIGVVQKVVNKKSSGRCLLIISGVNVRKYIRKDPAGKKIETKEFPIDYSNVLPVCNEEGDFSRVGFKTSDGVKSRYLKKINAVL